MTRRDLLQKIGFTIAAKDLLQAAPPQPIRPLPGTQPLTWDGDLAERMMDGAHKYVERIIVESVEARRKYWIRDLSSRAAYEKSVEPNRERFLKIIGVVDPRVPVDMERFGDDDNPALVAETDTHAIHQVRWPVLDRVSGEGLLLEPKRAPAGYVVALPDADQTPEQITGLASGVAAENQFARRLAENGFVVLIPTMIDRTSRWSGRPDIHMTDQPHREWIYRQAYQMGRHIIGYEVQKVLAAVDWFELWNGGKGKIGVAGYSEGGLIALYSAAADTRIDAALVSGYFDSRQAVWSEPIYRNVWALLHEFGDAELGTLIAPRSLIVEYSRVPDITSPKGDLKTPKFETVRAEFDRIDALTHPGFASKQLVSGDGGAPTGPGSEAAIEAFVGMMDIKALKPLSAHIPTDSRRTFAPGEGK